MYKVWVHGVGETTWSTNGLEFDTLNDAKTYARDLFARWFGIDNWAVVSAKATPEGRPNPDWINSYAIAMHKEA